VATSPAFASTPKIGAATVSTANTNRDGTGTIATVLTAASAGTKVTSIRVVATGDPADSIVNIFLYDGTTYYFFDSFDLGNPTAASATADAYSARSSYADLVLPSGWSIRASITGALTSGVMNVFAFAGDLT
jgi:hypothetical protein